MYLGDAVPYNMRYCMVSNMEKIMDKKALESGLDQAVATLSQSEKLSKDTMKVWCNHVVDMVHAYGQVAYLNKIIGVLSPMNKKVAIEFFKHFAGYHYNKDTREFDGKSKKRYIQAVTDWKVFKEDPLKNIWTWAEQNIVVERAPFKVEDVTKRMSSLWKEGHAAGLSNVDILVAALKAQQPGTKGKKNNEAPKLAFSVDDVANALIALGVEGNLEVDPTSPLVLGSDQSANILANAEEALI